MSVGAPLPPEELARRGGVPDHTRPLADFDEDGRYARRRIDELLGPEWSWEGKRVLDFGCGSGRVLRHFLDVAERAEVYGCDVDEASIEWLRANLSPPLRPFVSYDEPVLPQPDDFFDLIYALSVFTHLTHHWAGWLLELRRVLKPGGILIASYLHEEPSHERVGMSVLHQGLD